MTDLLPTFGPWSLCALAVVVGTVIQRLSGAGFGMVAAPAMTLAAPDWVPGTILLVGLAVGAGALLGTRDAVVRSDLPPGFAGRTLGAVAAAFVAGAVVGTALLPIVVACVVLLAVVLSLAGLRVAITGRSLFGAGVAAGVMGTLTGIGAPPMAILYANVEARRSAATQNAFFGFGMAVSIAALALAGLIRAPHLLLAATLVPLVPVTLLAVRPLAARFERGAIRPWALGLAAASALVLLGRALLQAGSP
ncbi:TSUP family transporter [Jannaschia sp. LMIT008]|uniref:TSUP family transporter n=1 Tax=Jannaschia maritima TaxID=3032585 RepID=UPI0028116973|nr:TSUP family transporter [Jannaschia sp. LMIT008]